MLEQLSRWLEQPEHKRSYASMRPRNTVRPEHKRSYASMRPRNTVRPEHKKGKHCCLPFCFYNIDYDLPLR